jgi:hypothetical protein
MQEKNLIIYVDDAIIFTDEGEIIPIITALSKVFEVKDLGPINTFVGCKIIEIGFISPN